MLIWLSDNWANFDRSAVLKYFSINNTSFYYKNTLKSDHDQNKSEDLILLSQMTMYFAYKGQYNGFIGGVLKKLAQQW